MQKKILLIVIVFAVLVVGFFGWRYISFGSLKSKCLAEIKSERVEIKAYFPKGVDLSKAQNLKDSISKISGVLSVEFEGEDQALIDFKNTHKGNAGIQKALEYLGGDNPLQSYASIKVGGNEDLDKLIGEVNSKGTEIGFAVERFDYDKSKGGAYNIANSLNFDYPLGDPKKIDLLNNCVSDGSSGVLRSTFQELRNLNGP